MVKLNKKKNAYGYDLLSSNLKLLLHANIPVTPSSWFQIGCTPISLLHQERQSNWFHECCG